MDKLSKTYKIAVIEDSTHKAVREKRSGVLRYFANHHNFQVLLLGHSQSVFQQLREPSDIVGIIDVGVNQCLKFSVPFVAIDGANSQTASSMAVNIDDHAIAEAAANFLIARGNTNFAFVETNLPYEKTHSSNRALGFRQTLQQQGYEACVFSPEATTAAHSSAELTILADWLRRLPKPCGVFAYADNRAQLVIDACNLAQLNVPGQINLISVDNDTEICEFCQPTLTSIWPDFEQAGYLGAQLLHQTILGKHLPTVTRLEYGIKRIVERASTQDLRGGGRLVSLANEYIRLHYREPINSTDIANHLNVSRRLLDMRFREITSTTVQKEIERLRMLEASRLLQNTELTALEISSLCGYKTYMAFLKAFCRAFNTTSTTSLRHQKAR